MHSLERGFLEIAQDGYFYLYKKPSSVVRLKNDMKREILRNLDRRAVSADDACQESSLAAGQYSLL